MGSKAFLYLGLLLSVVLLISSEVAARDLAEASNKKVDDTPNGVDDEKYGGNNGGYPGYGGRDHGGRDHGDYPGHGGRGGGGRGGGGHGGGHGGGYPPRGRCYHGCCRRSYYGRECLRCCSYAGEAVEAETEAKPHN